MEIIWLTVIDQQQTAQRNAHLSDHNNRSKNIISLRLLSHGNGSLLSKNIVSRNKQHKNTCGQLLSVDCLPDVGVGQEAPLAGVVVGPGVRIGRAAYSSSLTRHPASPLTYLRTCTDRSRSMSPLIWIENVAVHSFFCFHYLHQSTTVDCSVSMKKIAGDCFFVTGYLNN